MDAKTVAVWITIVSAIATGVSRFSAVEERQANLLTELNRLGHELQDVRGYLTAAENRISVVERDREMLERVHALEVRLSAIEARRR